MSTIESATHLLLQLLATESREPAARLKQRLNARLIDMGLGPFDQRALGFKTFKDYLRSLGAHVSIEERPGSDILVSLGRTGGQSTDVTQPLPPPLRGGVWLAFTNPDPERLRYYCKRTGKVEHQLASEQLEVENADPDRILIVPISAAEQSSWMRDFIESHSLQSETLLEQIAATPYTSSVHAAFSKALGEKSVEWRRFRTNKVFDEVRKWATRYGVDIASLQQAADNTPSGTHSLQTLSPRLRAAKLLESFSDQELIDLVIPILAASALVKSRV